MRAIYTFFVVCALLLPTTIIQAHDVSGEQKIYIHMSETGFNPEKVTIKQGDTIVFENIGTTPRWPASNIHPTHSAYPNSGIEKCNTDEEKKIFDACRGIKSGETYEFTFTKPGLWRFHDHIDANLSGGITVEAVEGYNETLDTDDMNFFQKVFLKIKTWFKNLFNSSPDSIEQDAEHTDALNFTGSYDPSMRMMDVVYEREDLGVALTEYGIEHAMQQLVSETSGGTSVDCHQEAHYVGRLGYEIYKEEAFSTCDASCHSGCYHGAMETLLAQEGSDSLAEKIGQICNAFGTRFGIFECLHGVGHGVMAYMDYNLPDSLLECDKLNNSFEQTSCYGGAFMENVMSGQGLGALPGHETKWVNRMDPLYPCNSIDQKYSVQYQCYQMQTSWMLTMYGYDFDRVAQECLNAPKDMIPVCFKSFGRDAAGNSLRNPVRMKELCDKVPNEDGYYKECVIGGVNVIIDFWGPALKEQASEFCSILATEPKETCYKTLSGRLHDLYTTTEEKQAVCDTFETDYQYLCGTHLFNN